MRSVCITGNGRISLPFRLLGRLKGSEYEMVEAGGIEPPSESLQRKASTCLSCILDLAPVISHRQDATNASLESSRPAASRHDGKASPLNDALLPPADKRGRAAVAYFLLSGYCNFIIVCDYVFAVFFRAHGIPHMQLSSLYSRRIRFAPLYWML